MGIMSLILMAFAMISSVMAGLIVISACMAAGRASRRSSIQMSQQARQGEMVEVLDELRTVNNLA